MIGENGAGKSTLMKILSGAYTKDEGQIYINGEEVEIHNTDQSQQLGIGIIYQELSLFPDLNAVDNIYMHREHTKTRAPEKEKKCVLKQEKVLADELDARFDVTIPVSKLRLGRASAR